MRKIKIEDIGKSTIVDTGKPIACPVCSHPESDGICYTNCAWFHIVEEKSSYNPTFRTKLAYCKDHCIGEIE